MANAYPSAAHWANICDGPATRVAFGRLGGLP